ncbi:MAG TPA: ABC transporter permease [Agromyces sp.]|nr:ABC transporter permease [Agromyces sp.]
MGLGDWLLPVYVVLAFIFLLIPIAYTFVFSFNDSLKSNIAWRGFTFDKWLNVCNVEGGAVCEAFGNSIVIGLVSTVAATTLGTMIAIALVRYRFRARSAISLLLFLPMATPEVVLGAGLAAQFLAVGVPKDMLTIILAHTMFCISFVVVTVKARVSSLDPALEEAGRDLYGSPREVFWRITFPLLLPGIMAAALLSFALSFDDFIITNFNSGSVSTFPKYIYISASRGIPAEANVIASAVFIVALALVIVAQVSRAARAKRLAADLG